MKRPPKSTIRNEMKIQEEDLYHGVALTQFVEHASYTARNKASSKHGHYLVNADRRMFVKYRTSEGTDYSFTFSKAEMAALAEDLQLPSAKVYLALVCGGASIWPLDRSEIETIIDPFGAKQQWIRVSWPEGGSMRVVGSIGELDRVVTDNSFPSLLFAP